MNIISINGSIDSYSRYLLQCDLADASGQPCTVVINSLGGYVHEGVAMAHLIQAHGNVTVEIRGFIASAATIVALGAKSVKMHTSSMWLAHKCMQWVDAWGNYNADEIAKVIQQLEAAKKNNEAIDLNIASIYLNKCGKKGKNMADVKQMMTDATWMTAQECLDWGFVNELIQDGEVNVNDDIKMVMNSFKLPIPGAQRTSATNVEPEDKEPSWLGKILAAITHKPADNKDEEIKQLKDNIANLEGKISQLNLVSDEYKEVITLLDSVSDEVKGETDNKKKMQMVISIINDIPANIPMQQKDKKDINKFAGVATDPVNFYVEE